MFTLYTNKANAARHYIYVDIFEFAVCFSSPPLLYLSLLTLRINVVYEASIASYLET